MNELFWRTGFYACMFIFSLWAHLCVCVCIFSLWMRLSSVNHGLVTFTHIRCHPLWWLTCIFHLWGCTLNHLCSSHWTLWFTIDAPQMVLYTRPSIKDYRSYRDVQYQTLQVAGAYSCRSPPLLSACASSLAAHKHPKKFKRHVPSCK